MSEASGESAGAMRAPAIFRFQPTSYEVVTGDRLGEWEAHMINDVGLGAVVDRLTLKFSGSPTVSRCGDDNQVDECDYIQF